MRFRLNPASAAEAPDAPEPAPATPPASRLAAPPAPGRHDAPPARPATSPAAGAATAAPAAAPMLVDRLRAFVHDRRLMVVAVVVLLVVFGSGTAAYMELSPTARYPERYLVADDEMPAGLANVPIPPEIAAQLGLDGNPGEMSARALSDFQGRSGVRPSEGWMQVIGAGFEADVVVLAFLFDSSGDADRWLEDAQSRCDSDDGTLYQHGPVAVLAWADDDDARPHLDRVLDVVLDKSPRLQRVC